MSHKVDKRRSSDISFANVKIAFPVPEFYAENSTLYLYPCSCNIHTVAFFGVSAEKRDKTGHCPSCSLHHVADSMGVSFSGVTAVWVGDTETGEYRGIYVTYGTFYEHNDTVYHPVIEYKRKGRRIDTTFIHGLDLPKGATTNYAEAQIKRALKGVSVKFFTARTVTKARKINDTVYIAFAPADAPAHDHGWYALEKFEY